MGSYFFVRTIFGLCNGKKNAWDKIILGLKNLQRDWAGKCAIFQMACNSKSVQFLTMQLIRVCTSAQKGPLLPSVPFENSKKKRNSQNVVLVFVPKTFSTLDHSQSIIWLKYISTPDFSTLSLNHGPFNPKLFNHELFNPDFATMNFWTMGVESWWLKVWDCKVRSWNVIFL